MSKHSSCSAFVLILIPIYTVHAAEPPKKRARIQDQTTQEIVKPKIPKPLTYLCGQVIADNFPIMAEHIPLLPDECRGWFISPALLAILKRS